MLAIKSENKLLKSRMIDTYEFLHNRGIEEYEIFVILPRIFELTSSPTLDAKDSLSDNKSIQSIHHTQATHKISSSTSEDMARSKPVTL